jgi:hypothetical protein
MSAVIDRVPVGWLLETGDAWVQYRARIDLLGEGEQSAEVQSARAAMLADERIIAIVDSLQDWPGEALSTHKKADHPLHRLSFLAEIGLRAGDPGLDPVIEKALATQNEDGAFQINVRMSPRFTGMEGEFLTWAICDAPVVLFSLAKLGADESALRKAAVHITGTVRESGFPCVAGWSETFHGPGKRSDPCPYSNLLALKALAACPFDFPGKAEAIQSGVEMLLSHWENQTERKIFLFGIGTDFRKPKFPFVWYDILHVLDVLSRIESARGDDRYKAMLGELVDQADAEGRFTPTSMYTACKGWDFANKKEPSPAITLLAWRIAMR